jgi:hypothetical protein
MFKTFPLVICLAFAATQIFAQSFRINEVMSSNTGAITDSDSETPDWIELHNAGPVSVNLKGYGLSDKKGEPFQWTFPDYVVNPGEYLLVFASGKDRREAPGYWNTIISKSDDWKYLVPTSEPQSNWRFNEFDDSKWPTGKSGFGFGDDDDVTKINGTTSVFMRKKFAVENPADVRQMVLHMDYDDGFVAYLNGKEIARSNMVGRGEFPSFDALATDQHEALIYQGKTPDKFVIDNPSTLLKTGENVLSVQVHNIFPSSTDMSALPFLSVSTASPPVNPRLISTLKLTTSQFHTNFKLDADGESVYFTLPSGALADSVGFGVIPVNSSYGRTVKNPQTWAVFAVSTPGKENSGEGLPAGEVGKPVFNLPGGVYAASLKLALTTSVAGDSVYYTLDGSEPGRQSYLYTGEININSSKVVKARILKSGWLPGVTVTNSYIFYENKKLPIVSISMNPSDLWDYYTGIYVKGPNAETKTPFFGANFWQDWERSCHFELIETTGNKVIDVNAGTKIYGNYSRANDQKSMAFYCRKSYGSEFMKYKIFKERPFDEFKDIVLRNSGNDWNNTMFRDALMTGLTLPLNVDQQAYRPAVVFLNGEYWGLLNLREKINEHFIASNHNVDPEDVTLLEGHGSPIVGNADDYWKMYSFMEYNSLTSQANYDQVVAQIDLDNYLDYTCSQIFYANHDWPGNNIKYWKTNEPGSRWRWVMFDTDFGMGIWYTPATKNSLEIVTATNGTEWHNQPWATLMLRRLLDNTGFRNQFINRFADLLNSVFLVDRVQKAINQKRDLIAEEMISQFKKWNLDPWNNWQTNVQVMKTFASERPGNVWQHIRQKFSLSAPEAITVDADSTAGSVQINSLKLRDFPWMGIYFPEVPVQLTAIPQAGYRFVKWEGVTKESNSPSITVNPQARMKLKAIFENDGSHYENVVINEISFNNDAPDNPGDWIELYNKGKYDIDLSGWRLTDSDPMHQFVFAANTWLKANEYLVVTNDLAKMKTVFGAIRNLIEPFTFSFGLANTVDAVKLYSREGQLIDEVNYKNSDPWQTFSLDELWSLELINPANDNNSGLNWVLSAKNGTPGMRNALFIPDTSPVLAKANACELLQNYPNPFIEGTYIDLKLAHPGNFRISILDVNGHVLRVIDGNDPLSSVHTLFWDGHDQSQKPVPAGVYFYRLEAEGFVEMKRMVKM